MRSGVRRGVCYQVGWLFPADNRLLFILKSFLAAMLAILRFYHSCSASYHARLLPEEQPANSQLTARYQPGTSSWSEPPHALVRVSAIRKSACHSATTQPGREATLTRPSKC